MKLGLTNTVSDPRFKVDLDLRSKQKCPQALKCRGSGGA